MSRFLVSISLSALVTFGLFYIMHALIAMQEASLGEDSKGHVIDFVRLKRDSELQTKKRKKPEREKPPEPPPPPDLSMARNKPTAEGDTIGMSFGAAMEMSGPNLGIGTADSDPVPLVRVNPSYPPRAEQRGLEGWVTVEFNISKTGSVKDPKVVDSSSSIFHRSAVNAVRRWKYNPKIEEGKAVEAKGVQVTLDFTFDEA